MCKKRCMSAINVFNKRYSKGGRKMHKKRNTSTLYLVDVGIILLPFHPEYKAYNQVYDRKNALYDEHQ